MTSKIWTPHSAQCEYIGNFSACYLGSNLPYRDANLRCYHTNYDKKKGWKFHFFNGLLFYYVLNEDSCEIEMSCNFGLHPFLYTHPGFF